MAEGRKEGRLENLLGSRRPSKETVVAKQGGKGMEGSDTQKGGRGRVRED